MSNYDHFDRVKILEFLYINCYNIVQIKDVQKIILPKLQWSLMRGHLLIP